MMFLAPAAGGVILSISTIETTFFIDVITAIIGIGMMCIIVVPAHAKVGDVKKSNVHDIKEGFKYLKDHAFIKLVAEGPVDMP